VCVCVPCDEGHVFTVIQGVRGDKGEPGNPGLPGFSGPKGPAVSSYSILQPYLLNSLDILLNVIKDRMQ